LFRTTLKHRALTEYLKLCIRLNEIPRESLLTLINGCGDPEALLKTIEIIKKGEI